MLTYNFGKTPDHVILQHLEVDNEHNGFYVTNLWGGAEQRVLQEILSRGGIGNSNFKWGHLGNLNCRIDPYDLLIILRRLGEMANEEDDDAQSLRNDILNSLDIREVINA
jgi:hypothetical protein